MAKVKANNKIININTYVDNANEIKMIETVKVYKYCMKCLKDFVEPSISAFCCWECQQDYYQEQAKELNTCFREWAGRD